MEHNDIPTNDADWKEKVGEEKYHILREAGTEPPFSGEYYNNKETGMYHCGGCGTELFSSSAKFDSGSGWPSFDDPAVAGVLELVNDTSFGMQRTEVRCKRCGSHLGHVFDHSPTRTGKYYCINSLALDFKAGEDGAEAK